MEVVARRQGPSTDSVPAVSLGPNRTNDLNGKQSLFVSLGLHQKVERTDGEGSETNKRPGIIPRIWLLLHFLCVGVASNASFVVC